MAQHSKNRNKTYVSNVLFDPEDEEHEEDEPITTNGFRSRNPPPQPKLPYPTGPTTMEETQKKLTLMKIQEIEKRTLDSASKSLGLLQECKAIGIRAAVALAHQGEQLESTNTKLDVINNNLNDSQKYINGIKSGYSQFINNVFSRKPDPPVSQREVSPSMRSANPSNNKIDNTLGNVSQRTNKIDNLEWTTNLHRLDWQYSAGPDDHLNEILHHTANLKEMGLMIGKETEKQNELIDVMLNKTEVENVKINHQNKQMNKILRK